MHLSVAVGLPGLLGVHSDFSAIEECSCVQWHLSCTVTGSVTFLMSDMCFIHIDKPFEPSCRMRGILMIWQSAVHGLHQAAEVEAWRSHCTAAAL